ncbi:FkbM family methyltransferase [Azospirillum brasilense]|uniref:FkbM family methyltransferase n=1 Tax=Azospirillum brasilense TaxID=192 RepID=UPI001EDB3883|nr:FkbM family methyltransferase [Azospirillum brasilense]UKJ78133.1 FkbM family methyltransferase [Azospirillum brasilense]
MDSIFTQVPGLPDIELVDYYEEFLWYYPTCEMEAKRWCAENIKPDWTVLDVGANIGYYSILFSWLAKDGFVFSFEPTDTWSKLENNLRHHNLPNVEALRLGIGKQSGRFVDSIFKIWGQNAERLEVDFYSIDDFVEQRRLGRVDLIKIDVDSFDLEALQGAERTLRTFDPYVLVELNHALSRRNQSNAEALHWLSKQGYGSVFCVDYDNFILKKSAPVVSESSVTVYFPER